MSDVMDQQLFMAHSLQQRDTTYTKIFVGGLPYHTTDKSLRQFFEAFGEIEEAVVITDRQTGKSRGYGFVTMSDPESAARAVKDTNPIIDGRKANVNLAHLGARHRRNELMLSGYMSAYQAAYPFMLQSQHGLTPHYLYPSTYLSGPGLILPGSAAAHAPLSPATAGALASPFYADYAPAYPPHFANGLDIGFAQFAAAASLASPGVHPHSNGGSVAAAAAAASLPPYLSPAAAANAAYAYAAVQPPPSHHQGLPAATPAHYPVPYPAQPQDARMN